MLVVHKSRRIIRIRSVTQDPTRVHCQGAGSMMGHLVRNSGEHVFYEDSERPRWIMRMMQIIFRRH